MRAADKQFTGLWLPDGERQGQQFSHDQADYDHGDNADAQAKTPMRHVVLHREGAEIGVWVPARWSDEQARDALDSNW